MSLSIPQHVADQRAREKVHFAKAPSAFLDAWKRGVELAGPELFGEGTRANVKQAMSKWDLCPNLTVIFDTLGCRNVDHNAFLAAMVSFYDADEGGALLRRLGIYGLAQFDLLNLEQRKVVAELLLHYTGWRN